MERRGCRGVLSATVRSRARNFLSVKRCFSIPRVPRSLVNLIGLRGRDTPPLASSPRAQDLGFLYRARSMQHFEIRSVAKWDAAHFLPDRATPRLPFSPCLHQPGERVSGTVYVRIYVRVSRPALAFCLSSRNGLQEVRQRERLTRYLLAAGRYLNIDLFIVLN